MCAGLREAAWVHADYMRAAIRMAALSHCGTLFVMTHDSIGLGEDGPTHQPVEHLASFRAMPNILMMRPGDGNETAGCYLVRLPHPHDTLSNLACCCDFCSLPCPGDRRTWSCSAMGGDVFRPEPPLM